MGVGRRRNVEVGCFVDFSRIKVEMFDESTSLIGTRYLYSYPEGQPSFFETSGIIYTLGGRPIYYLDGDYVYVFESGKPAFSIRENHLYPAPAGSQPSYYFGN
jgi:hypothetical protein